MLVCLVVYMDNDRDRLLLLSYLPMLRVITASSPSYSLPGDKYNNSFQKEREEVSSNIDRCDVIFIWLEGSIWMSEVAVNP